MMNCGNCSNCIQQYYSDCVDCKNCTGCYGGNEGQNPPGLKGHTLLAGRQGIIIYGGIKLPYLNMTLADKIRSDKAAFTSAC